MALDMPTLFPAGTRVPIFKSRSSWPADGVVSVFIVAVCIKRFTLVYLHVSRGTINDLRVLTYQHSGC